MMQDNPINGKFPRHWQRVTLGELCNNSGGQIQTGPFGSQLHAADYVSIGVPCIMPINIGEKRVLKDDIKKITEDDAIRLHRHRLQKGDLIYSRRGDVERHALIEDAEDGWLCGTGCLKVRLGNCNVLSKYASYYLSHPSVKNWISRHAIGSTMPNLNTSIMASVPFLIPPIDEQIELIEILGPLDEKIELNRQMNQTLEQMARALFKSWFVDFDPVVAKAAGKKPFGMSEEIAALFPDKFVDSEFGRIPKGWRVSKLKGKCQISSGKRQKDKSLYKDDSHQFPLYGGGGLMGYVPRPLLDKPIIITGRVGTLGLVFMEREPCWPSDNTLVLQANCQSMFEFIYFYLNSIDLALMNRGSTQPLLTQGDLKQLDLVIPQNEVLWHYHKISESFFSLIDSNNEEIEVLNTIRDTLLPKLLSGEIRVKTAEKLISEAV